MKTVTADGAAIPARALGTFRLSGPDVFRYFRITFTSDSVISIRPAKIPEPRSAHDPVSDAHHSGSRGYRKILPLAQCSKISFRWEL